MRKQRWSLLFLGGFMKDVIRHLQHTQKKVLQSVRKAENNSFNSPVNLALKESKNAYYKQGGKL